LPTARPLETEVKARLWEIELTRLFNRNYAPTCRFQASPSVEWLGNATLDRSRITEDGR